MRASRTAPPPRSPTGAVSGRTRAREFIKGEVLAFSSKTKRRVLHDKRSQKGERLRLQNYFIVGLWLRWECRGACQPVRAPAIDSHLLSLSATRALEE